MFICEISANIILIRRKLEPTGPVQQKIKLPSPKGNSLLILNLKDLIWPCSMKVI